MPFVNPVYPAYFADPFAFRHVEIGRTTYYAIGTGRDERDVDPVTGNVVPMIKSADLRHWEPVGHVLRQPEEERGGVFWAPEVAVEVVGGAAKFYLYFSSNGAGKAGGEGLAFRIRCAVADRPEGPYVDMGVPLTDGRANPFSIDAHVFEDDDGSRYLFYATDFLDIGESFRGTGLVVDRMTSMISLEGKPRVVKRATCVWQLFKRDRDMYGSVADWFTLEGPTVVKRQGKYWLFYSGGCYENDTYGVDVLVADHPLGPWHSPWPELTARGPQVIRTVPGKVIGPGHNSILTGDDGEDYVVYHAWNLGMTERQLWIDPLLWTRDGPVVERYASHVERHLANV